MNDLTQIFGPKGVFSRALKNYEFRGAQMQMAEAVQNAIRSEQVLLAEAGTGTGKTLAYLVPAMLCPHTVVVSTRTKNLQEQIFFKDIRFLAPLLDFSGSAHYLKGQENYLCLRRFEEFRSSPAVLSYPPGSVAQLESWVNDTASGDRMELETLTDDDPLWNEICSTRETRIGSKCRYYPLCFVTKARQNAMNAQLLITNHHLYFADVATRAQGGSILPRHDLAIFDEAHSIEDIATEFFSTVISSGRIERLVRDTVRASRLERKLPLDYQKLTSALKRASAAFFEPLRGPLGKTRYIPEEATSALQEGFFRLDSALDALEHFLKSHNSNDEVLIHLSKRFEDARSDLEKVVAQTKRGHVHWIETRARSVSLGASPVDVSERIREEVFFSVPSVIMTSATLATGSDFSFFKRQIGIDFDVQELKVPSPFDYASQSLIYVPKEMPDPRDTDFLRACTNEASRLIKLTEGGMLFLFTSTSNMSLVKQELAKQVDYPVVEQGEAPKTTLIERFIENPHTVLCATASFWQGVDIPGDALRIVVIDKLPFASPAQPLIAARIEYLSGLGFRPFIDYQVPQAALNLKQGFGRLIRTRTDRGIVAILDRRLHTMPYARTFWASLPSCPRLTDFEDVKKRWAELNHLCSPQEIAAHAD